MKVLGRKQMSKNEDFVKVWNNIEQLISFEEAERHYQIALNATVSTTLSSWMKI